MIILLLILCIFPVYSFSLDQLDQNEAALIITRAVALKALHTIVLKNSPSVLDSFKKFKIFDDRIDTNQCHQNIVPKNNIERYKLARAAIKSGINHYFMSKDEKLVHIVTIDKDGMYFSYRLIKKENSNFSYVMKPTQFDKQGNLRKFADCSIKKTR